MEPRIQYAKTSDGVSIAFWTMGEGLPLFHLPPMLPFSHIQREWQHSGFGRWYKRMAARTMLVRYDARGTGMSQREGVSFSLKAFMLDVQAVVDHLGLDRFALLGFLHSGLIAIPYAIEHPENVSHVVLWCSHGPLTEYASSRREALHSLIDRDWELFTQTIAHTRLGWSGGEDTREIAAYLRESMTQNQTHAAYGAVHELEVMTLLPQLKSPTLVFHRRDLPVVNVSVAMDLASGIPGGQLIVLEGASAAPYLDDMEDIAVTIEVFLGISSAAPVQAVPSVFGTGSPATGTAVILFADIADSTGLTERLGDAAFREKARGLDTALRAAIRENGGTPVEGKLLGDGVLAVFTSARQAIEAALACAAAGSHGGLPLHLGVHAGDVIREENNVYGGAVNIASRISGLSAAGEVLVSETVRSLARTSAGVRFEDRGEQSLKGVGEPVRVWAVREAQ